MNKRILIIGSCGLAGSKIAKLILKYIPNVELLLAGRKESSLLSLQNTLQASYSNIFINYKLLDLQDPSQLSQGLQDIDLVINASSTLQYTEQVIQAILRSSADYMDIQLSSPEKLEVLRKYEKAIKEAQKVVITDGGFHPGIPAAMARYANAKVGHLTEAHIYCLLRIDWVNLATSKETENEFFYEFKHYDNTILQNKKWLRPSFTKTYSYEFDEPFGEVACTPMLMEEIRQLPDRIPSLKEAGFYISGINPITDFLIMPIAYMGIKYMPVFTFPVWRKLLRWGLNQSKPPFGIQLIAKCIGSDKKIELRLSHPDPYFITAAPAVSAIKQYLDDPEKKPGLYLQAFYVDPAMFMEDLESMGVEIGISTSGL